MIDQANPGVPATAIRIHAIPCLRFDGRFDGTDVVADGRVQRRPDRAAHVEVDETGIVVGVNQTAVVDVMA